MIAPAIFFLAAALMFCTCVALSGVLIMTDQDDTIWWPHLMRWMRVSVALGVITAILTILTAVLS